MKKNKSLKTLFEGDIDIQRIITALQAETGTTIESHNTLIIFDEIQEAAGAFNALKHFQEDAPDYHLIAAGSLLGVALNAHTSFPVGKVAFMDLHPLNYLEFLDAVGDSALKDMLVSNDWKSITAYKQKCIERLRQYYYVGGMPEVVLRFSETHNFTQVRELQKKYFRSLWSGFFKIRTIECCATYTHAVEFNT